MGEQMSIRDVVTVCDALRAVLAEIDAGRVDTATVLDRLAGTPDPPG